MRLAPNLQRILSGETAYQIVMVAALLELLLLAGLMPRTPNSGAPVAFAAIAGLRLMTLLALAALLAAPRQAAQPLEALAALCIWGAMLAPPELWAAALELKAGLPVTTVSSIALSLGFYAALRLQPVIGWGYFTLIFSALYVQDWKLEPLGLVLIAVIALGIGLWLLGLWLLASRTGKGAPA